MIGKGMGPTFPREELMRSIAYRVMLLLLIFGFGIIILVSCSREVPQGGPDTQAPVSPAADTVKGPVFDSGVIVSGVDIGGLTEYEAAKKLVPAAREMMSEYECTLRFEEKRFTVRSDEVNLSADLGEVLLAAMEGGRGEYELSVAPLNDEKLGSAVDAIAEQIDEAPAGARLITVYEAKRDGIPVESGNARFALTAPADGKEVDTELTAALIASGRRSIELPVSAVPAGENAPELPVRRAVFSTSFASGSLSAPNRVKNIVRAVSMLNGLSLAPGERFSVNAVLGERTEELGWLPATAFANGGSETQQQAGGGICQVSTTLYNCSLLAGLNVPERHGHSRRVSYVPGGRDAALSYPTSDLVIENSTDARIYIYLWADESECRLYAEIYGGAFGDEFDEINILSELAETLEPGEPEFTADTALSPGDCVLIRSAITGSRWVTYRAFMKDGAEVRRERIDETYYAMHPALYAVAPAEP
ncbi:MAG: VanW family protein [Clostridia bacterium]|nr:VanW family protein [Clostridia bacterium]